MSTTPKETVDVSGLYDALTARIKEQIEGVTVESKKNKAHAYAAIEVGGKNVGYVTQGKRGVSVQIRKGKDAGTRSVKTTGEVGPAVTALSRVAETLRGAEPKASTNGKSSQAEAAAKSEPQAKSDPKPGSGKKRKTAKKKSAA